MVEAIRAGSAPLNIRRKGAEGGLPVPLEEKIEILVLLADDQDPEVRRSALASLDRWDAQQIARVVSAPLTPSQVIDFCATRLAPRREDILEAVLANPALPDALNDQFLVRVAAAAEPPLETESPAMTPGSEAGPRAGTSAHPSESSDQNLAEQTGEAKERETLLQKISRMSTVQKIKAALTGNQGTRLVLIRDANKVVARAVLQSPKLSEGEIEAFASMKNVSEEVLRLIALNRGFMKNYGVMHALVNNPRSPIDVTLPLLNRLNDRDLKGLMLNRNVPDVIRSMATKMVKQKEEANKPKLFGKKH